MTDSDLTVAILREIRDEIRGTNSRLDHTNARLDQTNARLDQTVDRLDQTIGRLDQTNSRFEVVEHTVLDAAGQLVILTRYVKNVVDRHEDAIEDLRDRVDVLESSSTSGAKR